MTYSLATDTGVSSASSLRGPLCYKNIAKERISRGLNKNFTPAADRFYNKGGDLYVYRELLKHWSDPHVVMQSDGKDVKVDLG